TTTIFLLSPAHCGGRRAATLFRPATMFDLAQRIRVAPGAPLGEVFSLVSGLYFRGKLAYAKRFGRSSDGPVEPLVITGAWRLTTSPRHTALDDLHALAAVPIDVNNPEYREPLLADLSALAASLPEDSRVVLLGSIATGKYVELLLSVPGDRLCFPADSVGLGDMSRGSILLKASRDGRELAYVSARGARRSLAARPASRSG